MSAAEQRLEFPVYVVIFYGDEIIFEKTFESLPITIGRSSHCDITISQFNWISRQHAIINSEGGRIYLVDLKSSNGIQLGGRTYDRVEVHNGTIASIGPLVIQFGLPLERSAQTRSGPTPGLYQSPVDVSPGPLPEDDKTLITHQGDHGGGRGKSVRPVPTLDDNSLVTEQPDPQPSHFHQGLPSHIPQAPVYPEPPIPPRGSSRSNDPTIIDRPRRSANPSAGGHHHQGPAPHPASSPKSPAKPMPYYLREEINPNKRPAPARPSVRADHGARSHQSRPRSLVNYVVDRDKAFDGIDRVPRHRRIIEAYVLWKGALIDTWIFWPGEQVVVGRAKNGLYIPTLKGEFLIADYDGSTARCSIPKRAVGYLRTGEQQPILFEELIRSQGLARKGDNYILKLGSNDICSLQLSHEVQINLRYAPAPRQLSKKNLSEGDAPLKKSLVGSGLVHFLFTMMCMLVAPKHQEEIVEAPRAATIIVQQEKPKPPEPPKKKEEPKPPEPPKKKEVKEPPKKVVEKKKPKPVKVVQKTPPKEVGTEKPVPGKKTEDLTQVGALAALGAINANAPTPNPANLPVAINVNQNAGGGGGKVTTSGIIGAIKAKGGQLQGATIAGVKTTGKGFGTGDGYGVQGIKGQAGTRGVAGSVVGTPTLMKINKTEGLTRKEVMDIVKNYLGEIQQCYERSLLTDPGIAGRVEYEWNISPKGAVQWAKVKKSDMRGGDSLNGCVLAIFKKMKFPVAKNGEDTTPNIGFPFGRL